MAKHKQGTVHFRRKREGKTNYKKRLQMLISRKPRLVIRKSLNNIVIQLIEFHPEGDKILVAASSRELIKMGWKHNRGNLPASYLTGLLFGQKARQKKVEDAILDMGLQTNVKGSRIYAALKGILDSGFNVPHSEDIFPAEERIKGTHISEALVKDFERLAAQLMKK
ncbi:50S ribosomal protein L18 [Candidatus Woesearchaeota archaeon]|nr:MAG: 50S ribosomal protein L18 [Candidatus Woesearchaeota archaeon]